MATLKDIARTLNTTPATVSRALNSKKGVGKVLRAKIWEVAESLEYCPDSKARALVGGKTGVIGIIIPRSSQFVFSNPYYPQLFRGLGKAAGRYGYNILLSFEGKESYATIYKKRLVDGVVLIAHRLDDYKIKELEDRNIPAVLVPGYPAEVESVLPSVDTENIQSTFLATKHLIKLKHKRIAFISGTYNSKYSVDRLLGFTKAMHHYGIEVRKEYVVNSDFSRNDGFRLMKSLLAFKPSPTAVIGVNDAVTLGALQAINSENKRVPQDFSIITIGESDFVLGFHPSLTSVRIPIIETGERAAEMLIQLVNGVKIKKKNVVLPSQFNEGESTGIPFES